MPDVAPREGNRIVKIPRGLGIDGHDRFAGQIQAISQVGLIELLRLDPRFFQHIFWKCVG